MGKYIQGNKQEVTQFVFLEKIGSKHGGAPIHLKSSKHHIKFLYNFDNLVL